MGVDVALALMPAIGGWLLWLITRYVVTGRVTGR